MAVAGATASDSPIPTTTTKEKWDTIGRAVGWYADLSNFFTPFLPYMEKCDSTAFDNTRLELNSELARTLILYAEIMGDFLYETIDNENGHRNTMIVIPPSKFVLNDETLDPEKDEFLRTNYVHITKLIEEFYRRSRMQGLDPKLVDAYLSIRTGDFWCPRLSWKIFNHVTSNKNTLY